MFPLPLHIYFGLAAAAVSILSWRSLSATRLRWFIPFLLFIVVVELSARYLTYELKQPNAWLFCLSVPFEYIFYAFMFWNFYQTAIFKKIAVVFMAAVFIYSIYSLVFITKLAFFDMNILVGGNLAMFVLSILYFVELYNYNDPQPLLKTPAFWIVTGIFLFNTGEFCYNLLSMLVIDDGFDKTLKIFKSINNSLILVLYSFFIIGFVCQKITGTSRRGSAFM